MSDSNPGDKDKQASLDLVRAIDTLGQLIEESRDRLEDPAPPESLDPDQPAAAEVPLLVDVVKGAKARGRAAHGEGRDEIPDMFAEEPDTVAQPRRHEADTLRQELIADLGALIESHLARLKQDVERIVCARFEAEDEGPEGPPHDDVPPLLR